VRQARPFAEAAPCWIAVCAGFFVGACVVAAWAWVLFFTPLLFVPAVCGLLTLTDAAVAG
jgi:hypothetical protein